jgi:6-phosphogluconate dehydrogenase
MQLGLVGLGKMGGNMRERLRRAGHEVVGYDRNQAVSDARSLADMVRKLDSPRVVWVMVPHGAPTRDTVVKLGDLLDKGDLVIDGGNSKFTEDFENEKLLRAKGIGYLDCGVSGGIWGLDNGYCIMVGGEEEGFRMLEPAIKTLAPDDGYAHVGPSGAGHFVKMVHNGIEYGLMQAYAEGFEIMKASEFDVDLHEVAGIWRYGSVVRSWLLELLYDAFEQEGNDLEGIAGYVEDSGEGRWTVFEAINESVPAPIIANSLFARFASRQDESFGAKINAALRKQFGGHAVKTE